MPLTSRFSGVKKKPKNTRNETPLYSVLQGIKKTKLNRRRRPSSSDTPLQICDISEKKLEGKVNTKCCRSPRLSKLSAYKENIDNENINKTVMAKPLVEIPIEEVQVPQYRIAVPISLNEEDKSEHQQISLETYVKRHEKLEKDEKAMLRRDRIWQKEERYRLKLLKLAEEPAITPNLTIEVHTRLPKM